MHIQLISISITVYVVSHAAGSIQEEVLWHKKFGVANINGSPIIKKQKIMFTKART